MDIQELYTAHEEDFKRSQELSRAMQRLRDEMLVTYDGCRKLLPVEDGGRFAHMKAQFKAYRKRDDIEDEIIHLKDHVNKCYAKFTVRGCIYHTLYVSHHRTTGILCCTNREHVYSGRAPIGYSRC